jgi:hypothetical protein
MLRELHLELPFYGSRRMTFELNKEGRGVKDINRTEENPDIQFTFLGYTFRPRKAVDKYDRVYVNFSPAVSRDALKAMRQTIRGWRVQLKNDRAWRIFRPCLARSLGDGSNITAISTARRSSRFGGA